MTFLLLPRAASRVARRLCSLASIAALLPVTGCAHSAFPREPADGSSRWAVVGEPAPDITLPAVDGGTVRLSTYAGHVAVVTFWATFCGPCRLELPALEAMRARHGEDLAILAVSIDDGDADDAVNDVVQRLGLHFPVLRDPDGRATPFAYMKHAMTPTTFLVGRDGRVRARFGGYNPQRGVAPLEDAVNKALAEGPAS